jgi:hypothetical protein
MQFDPGSFRDPSGRVLRHEGRVLRAIFPAGASQFGAAKDSGVLDEMIGDGWLLPANMVIDDDLAELAPGAVHWLEHPVLDFVSYPYEWCFAALKAAALHHLDFHIALLGRGFTLSDATAYNIQFRGTRPVVRRQNIWHNSRRKLAECGPRPGVDIKRRSCGAASADVRWSSV